MTSDEVLTDLIGNLIYARCGWGDWAKRVKAAGLPGWPQTFETAGALARMPSYKETVPLSLAESPRYTSQLWRQLLKDQRTWLTKSLIKDIDGEYPRDLWKWFNVLDFMRATHEPRT